MLAKFNDWFKFENSGDLQLAYEWKIAIYKQTTKSGLWLVNNSQCIVPNFVSKNTNNTVNLQMHKNNQFNYRKSLADSKNYAN